MKFKSSPIKIFLIAVWVLFLALIIVALLLIRWYNSNLKPVDNLQTENQPFVVVEGSDVDEIATNLEKQNLIKNVSAFKWYVNLNSKATHLQAGTFNLSPSLYVSEIVDILSSGLAADIQVTVLPEKQLKDLEDSLHEQGFKLADIQAALQVSNYQQHPLFKRNIIPFGADLEGYIAPETFAVNQLNAESAKSVIQRSLDVFVANLSPEIEAGILKNFQSVHEGVILASIVEKEVEPADRAKAAQVFIKRLKMNMKLGSDVTFEYACALGDGPCNPSNPSPYNTRIHKGLPPGPISNVSLSSLQAVANPASTNYLYFVSGDNDINYFNETLAEHLADAERYCKVKCGR